MRVLTAVALWSLHSYASPPSGVPDLVTHPWLKWGPFRPHLYMGIRPHVPESLLMGLMWANGDSRSEMLRTLRDTCEQDDGMAGYGWTMYDTRVGGTQVFHDSELKIDLTTEFIKSMDGDAWSLRIHGEPREGHEDESPSIAVIFHAALELINTESGTKAFDCRVGAHDRQDGTAALTAGCNGTDPALGDFHIDITVPDEESVVKAPLVRSLLVTEDKIWQAEAMFTTHEADIFGFPRHGEPGNMHFIGAILKAPFNFDINFSNGFSPVQGKGDAGNRMDEFKVSFPRLVDEVFPRSAPFSGVEYHDFAATLISNLLGGLGFFHGDSTVDESHAPEYNETGLRFWKDSATAMAGAQITTKPAQSLLSHTPSRQAFPRGFLWDEGFHLLPVVEWDMDLAIEVLKSWLNLMDEDGWIPREQILGPEARSKVPPKFQVQFPHYANPLTLVLVVPAILSKLSGQSPYQGHASIYMESEEKRLSLLNELYPLLERHHEWFRRTQAGDFSGKYPRPEGTLLEEGYRWRGRTPSLTLTSGLDDYPRAQPPHPGELHVDALSWVAASAGALRELSSYLGNKSGEEVAYSMQAEAAVQNLDLLHWNSTAGAYCDATIDGDGNFAHACHLGYVSLMPLFLGLLKPNHEYISPVLDLLSDPEKIWTRHGLRSLSARDPNYNRDEDYWRGAIWMNLNVLAVQRLADLGRMEGREQERARNLAADLRENVVRTVFDSWKETGFVWEQYSDVTGKGQRSKAFTGWTTCVLLLLGLDDLAKHDVSGPAEVPGVLVRDGIGLLSTPVVVAAVGLMVVIVLLRKKMLRICTATWGASKN